MTDLDTLCQSSISTVSALLKSRAVSPRDLAVAMLARITSLDPALGCYVTVVAERALQQASVAEQEIAQGRWRGPLHGIPMGIKGLFYTRDIATGVGSKILADWVPSYDAHVVERLDEAGAVLLGKHAMTEFAFSGYIPASIRLGILGIQTVGRVSPQVVRRSLLPRVSASDRLAPTRADPFVILPP